MKEVVRCCSRCVIGSEDHQCVRNQGHTGLHAAGGNIWGDDGAWMRAGRDSATYDPTEQDDIIEEFVKMLRSVTADGGRKRAAGLKPSWKVDEHTGAMFRHIHKWQNGEKVDPDSGAHPLVHAAWRALAVAYQETHECES